MADTPATPPGRTAKSLLSSRWPRRFLWALGGLLLFWLLGWLGGPPLLKWQLEKQGSALLGRALTVEQVRLRPWSLELWVDGLRVADSSGQASQLAVKQLYIDAELQSLLRLAPVIDALRIDSPQIAVRHLGEGRWDSDDVLQRLAPQEAEPARDEGAARFAVFNIQLLGGQVRVVDAPVDVTHELTGLELAVPFLSNIGSRREVVTEPVLAFTLNGSDFDSRAATRPFADDRQTRARLQIPELDLKPYLPYWPRAWPLRLRSGVLHLDLTADFEQHQAPALVLAGTVGLSQLRLDDAEGAVLQSPRLDIELERVEPLVRRVALGSVRWQGAELDLRRDAQGQLNLMRLASEWRAPASGRAKPAEAVSAEPPAADSDWTIQIKGFELREAQLRWRDAAVKPAAETTLRLNSLAVAPIHWPLKEPARVQLAAAVGEATLKGEGELSAERAQLRTELQGWPLRLGAPYLAALLEPELEGQARGRVVLDWARGAQGAADQLSLKASELLVERLRVGPEAQAQARWASLRVGDLSVDLNKQHAELAQLTLDSPQLELRRDRQGRWMVERWLKPQQPAPADPQAKPWTWRLADVRVQGGRVNYLDEQPAEPVRLQLDRIELRLQDVQPPGPNAPEVPLNLKLRAAAANGRNPGTLASEGRLRLPGPEGRRPDLGWRGRVQVERFPVHALEPYLAEQLNLELLRADTSARGQLDLALPAGGLRLNAKLDVAVEDFRANTASPGEELLRWASLQLRGLQLRMAPGQPMGVEVAETVLSDYFARIAIDPNGRINLQDLVKKEGEPAAGPAQAAAPAPAPAAAAGSSAAAPAEPGPQIRFGPTSLVNGRIRFSDQFVRPNYTANLSEVTGSLSAFSNTPPAPGQPLEMATLALKGRAEGTATLDINGQINPLAQPLALDIKGAVRDLELPPLSPYTVKYAGYGIERGKLSLDVSYRIEPNGQLTASNQVILNQLAFGERVAGSNAPNLPVKLAVALLADRSGVIDVNLPISGSLNDPQFRLGPLIVRMIFNLIGKAVTAPFSLIANAFAGGGGDASEVRFEAGRAELDEGARQQLDSVAKALENRPALRLTIVGQSDLEAERAGWQRARLDAQLRAEKRRRLARAGGEVPAQIEFSAQERPELLREVYRRADLPKPRNLVGLAKDIPLEEMEALLLAAQTPTADALRELAVQRAMLVKDYLASQRVPEDRLYLGAPKTAAAGKDWRPQAELQLATR